MAVISGTGSVELPQGHVLEGMTIYGACAQDGTPTPDSPVEIKRITSLALSTSDGQRVEIDLQGHDMCSHTRTERYRDVLTIGADGHVTLEKRTQRETVTKVDKVSGTTTVYAGLTATPKPKRWATYAEAATEGYGGSLWCDMLPHAGNNPYTQATWNGLYAYAPQSAGWGQDEFNALVGAEVIDYMPGKDWYTVDLGYVELPDVRDASTLSVIADVEPEIEVTTSEYSIAGGGASMNGRNLLRFTGHPTYAGDNNAANRQNGWCRWYASGTVTRTDDGIKYTQDLSTQLGGFVIPLISETLMQGGEDEVVTLSFQYRGTMTIKTQIYLLANTGGNVLRWSDAPFVANETDWQTFEQTLYFPTLGSRWGTSILIPYTNIKDSWLEIKDGTMKLEYGTAATPWRPAPEDIEQPSDLVYASDGVDLGDTSGLDTRLTTAEASITEQAGQIALKANAADVNTKAETTALLEVKANKATLTSEINASADTVKIDANRVDITGEAVFSAINGDTSTTKISGGKIDTEGITIGQSQVSGLKDAFTDIDSTLEDVAENHSNLENSFSTFSESATEQFGVLSDAVEGVDGKISSAVEAEAEARAELDTSTDERLKKLESAVDITPEGINIAAAGSAVTSRYTANALQFLYGSEQEPVAYIGADEDGNGKLYVTNAVVVQELQFGNWAFTQRQSGNLSLKWIEKTEEE